MKKKKKIEEDKKELPYFIILKLKNILFYLSYILQNTLL